ncbi:uncharacterized protein NECHADRAFT_42425 [Fusarium vanettenii 77-13-4]|uniref:Uncharacterized protein n=1 Tax=Fusarium vanettenii (strain ATCC MYA-4622 / CBS 123669 / FGSC 9596 / NRRL 45880 / 77-13-4) TaxID=660122 RepID=C7ZHM2_FUSV7|nr:uncharacterized protein NECHADRAFT_42425 [Fusarium vanettenii 77-13-4]EEU36518.1 hypothetical protein NECHADRAFT_42425 [Fusarium vanettenii 77-13-4]
MPLPTPVSPDRPGRRPRSSTGEPISSQKLNEEDVERLFESTHDLTLNRCIISVDFGTTASAVSTVKIPRGCSPDSIDPRFIRSIGNFPDVAMVCRQDDPMWYKVPTEVMYPANSRYYKQEDIVPEEASDTDGDVPMRDQNHGESDESDDEDADDPQSFRWGYQVGHLWSIPTAHSNQMTCPLARFKLLLDKSKTTKPVRSHLGKTLKPLCNRMVIKNDYQPITDFLSHLLAHTKSELAKEGVDGSWQFEVVLCVPAIWDPKALRIMQTCLALAMKRAKFPGVDIENNSIERLFIVSEPEAAATYMVSQNYGFRVITPRRPRTSSLTAAGGLCGSSYLNEYFREHLLKLLENQTQLEVNGVTIRGIVEFIMMKFETTHKRCWDIYLNKKKLSLFVSGNLKPGKGLKGNSMFLRLFVQIGDILKNQIIPASNYGYNVDRVILMGGFSGSPSLQKWLEKFLEGLCKSRGLRPIKLRMAVNAVSQGAILRALDKKNGPARFARSSYGLLRSEPWGNHIEHSGQNYSVDPVTGEHYVLNTIEWVLKKGDKIGPNWVSEKPLETVHYIEYGHPLFCQEVIYVSDTATKSHYRVTHKKNKGAQKAGTLVVDFTFLQKEGLIKPIEPEVGKNGKLIGKRHWKVEFLIYLKMIGRDLNGKVINSCRINIAPGFDMGTM